MKAMNVKETKSNEFKKLTEQEEDNIVQIGIEETKSQMSQT